MKTVMINGTAVQLENVTGAARPVTFTFYVVRDVQGAELGLLRKGRNSRTDLHPWTAFRLDGDAQTAKPNTCLGHFYDDSARRKLAGCAEAGSCNFGGRDEALAAILRDRANVAGLAR